MRHKLHILSGIVKYRSKMHAHRYATYFRGFFVDKTPDYEKLSKCKNLIFCAHPDDETLFFFSVLGEGTYVVCMSNCAESTRKKEFFRALEYKKCDGIMFNYPDTMFSNWLWSKFFMKKRFNKIKDVLSKDCKIYTHSIEGESEHGHHFATGRAVDYYFCDFDILHTVVKVEDAKKLSERDLQEKRFIMTDIYSSQIKMLTRWCSSWFEDFMQVDSFLK